jgi:acetyl esterase/lipase
MQGGWSDETMTLGTPKSPSSFKHTINHAIAADEMKPLIIVCPTYNNTNENGLDFASHHRVTENPNSQYFDPPDFRPNMVYFPAKEGMEVKGAVLIAAGGAFRFRSDTEEMPVAEAFSKLGYQSFVVSYRLQPYSIQEGALDLGRAV